jgi:hypothetical protein
LRDFTVARRRCVSPTSATDSRHEHPADCLIPGCTHSHCCAPHASLRGTGAGSSWAIGLAAARHGGLSDPLSGCADQVELRLTANLLLQRSSQPSRDPRRVARERVWRLAPNVHVSGEAQSWRGHDRRPLRAMPLVHGVFYRATSLRRCLWRPLSRPSVNPVTSGRQTRPFPAVSSKTTAPAGPGRLPSNECSLPRSHAALSLGVRGISRSPPPVPLLACSWLSPLRPGFRRVFTA